MKFPNYNIMENVRHGMSVMSVQLTETTSLVFVQVDVKAPRYMEMPVTSEQLRDYYRGHELIRVALPQLTPDQREFLLSGLLPAEFDALFGLAPSA